MDIIEAHNKLLDDLYDLVHNEVCRVTDKYKRGDKVNYYELVLIVCNNARDALYKYMEKSRGYIE